MPTIDLSCLHDHTKRASTVLDIGEACQNEGWFKIVNHGIHETIVEGALEAARQFFELDGEEKKRFASEDVRRPVRYSETPARSMLKLYAHPTREWIPSWPSNPITFRERMGNYTAEVRRVASDVLGAIFESLGLGELYLKSEFAEGLQLLPVNWYPRSSCTDAAIGATPHTDAGYITILLQSCDGLQVMRSRGEGWRSIHTEPGTLHVLVGDYLEVSSNGMYRSLLHRALLNPEKERISIASIQNLAIGARVVTAAELVDEQHPIRYRDCSFSEHLDHFSSKDPKGPSFLDTLRISCQQDSGARTHFPTLPPLSNY